MPDYSSMYRFVDSAMGGVNLRNNVVDVGLLRLNGVRTECYASYMRATEDLSQYAESNLNEKGNPSVGRYPGKTWTDALRLDFDYASDPSRALDWLRQTCARLESMGVNLRSVRFYFSGAKGFHAEIPATLFGGFEPSESLHVALKRAGKAIMGEIPFDPSIYDKLRLWRIPNSKNGKTALYKIPLTPQEVLTLDLSQIRFMATTPRDVSDDPDLTPIPDDEWDPVAELVAIWQDAIAAPEQTTTHTASAVTDGDRDAHVISAIATSWPEKVHGVSRHADYLLPLAGYLCARTSKEHALDLIVRGAIESNDREFLSAHRPWKSEIERIVNDSARKIEADEPHTGGGALAEKFPALARVLSALWPDIELKASTLTADDIDRGTDLHAETSIPRERFHLYTAQEMKLRQPPRPLIAGFLFRDSLAALSGSQATFKSFLALDMSLSIATGLDWQDREAISGPTVYISAEGSAGLKWRIEAWEVGRGVDAPASCYFLPEAVQFLQAGDVNAVIDLLKALPEAPILIVVDTLARTMAGGDENSARDMGAYVSACDRIRIATKACILIIHHVARAGNMRGSTALPGALDTQIEVKREANYVTLECGKQKDAEEFEPILLVKRDVDIPNGKRSLVFDLADENANPLRENARKIGLILFETFGDEGATTTQWQQVCEEAKVSRAQFYKGRRDLVEKGIVQAQNQGRGSRYFISRYQGLTKVSEGSENLGTFRSQGITPSLEGDTLRPKPSAENSRLGSCKVCGSRAWHRTMDGWRCSDCTPPDTRGDS